MLLETVYLTYLTEQGEVSRDFSVTIVVTSSCLLNPLANVDGTQLCFSEGLALTSEKGGRKFWDWCGSHFEGDKGSGTPYNTHLNPKQLSNAQVGHLGLGPNSFLHISQSSPFIVLVYLTHAEFSTIATTRYIAGNWNFFVQNSTKTCPSFQMIMSCYLKHQHSTLIHIHNF